MTKPTLPQGYDMVWDDDTESYEVYRDSARPGWAEYVGRISAWGDPTVYDVVSETTHRCDRLSDGQAAIDWIVRESAKGARS